MDQSFTPPAYIGTYLLLTIIGFLLIKRKAAWHFYFWEIMPGKTYHIFLCKLPANTLANIDVHQKDWNNRLNLDIGVNMVDWDAELSMPGDTHEIYYKIKIKKKHVNTMTMLILTYSNG